MSEQGNQESKGVAEGGPAMTSQQQRFSKPAGGALGAYRALVVGNRGVLALLGYELYQLFVASLPGLLGYGLRRALLPRLLGSVGRAVVVGRQVSIRLPHRIEIGDRSIIDDFATLDVRDDGAIDAGDTSAGIQLGSHCFVGRHSILAAKGGCISFADAVNVSSSCRIATQSSVAIGESTLIAAYCYIGPGNHKHEAGKALIESEMENKGGVRIGAHCWIGAHSTILDGVTIGDGAIVGAHSLVKDDVPPGAVVAGAPAKVIRTAA